MACASPRFSRVLPLGLLAVLLLGLAPPAASGQSISRLEQTETNVNSFFYYVQPGAATIRTHVMGTVRYPGLYVVSEGTRLDELLSLSGGAVLDERERRSRRTVTIRLLRDTNEGRTTIFETTSREGQLNTATLPVLQDGDVMEIEVVSRRRFGLRTALTIVNTVALVGLALERFDLL